MDSMRRQFTIATFVLLLASTPVVAQHGGGHAGGGHAGFSGGRGGGFAGHSSFSGGHVAASHSFSGSRGFSGARGPIASRGFNRFPSRSGFSRGPFLHNEFRGPRISSFGFRNNCIGFPCRGFYGYPWAGYYDPWWWWDSGSSYDEDYERDRALANEVNQQSLEEQQMLRQEEADGDQDAYARAVPTPRQEQEKGSEKEGAAIMPATVLVFRDQHKQEVQNYAIVGQTLWAFTPQRTQRIPLAELDLTATAEANDDRGLSFRIPTTNRAR